jgi:dipeptidyl aminopeptidase/acylaminoacyl peptidase
MLALALALALSAEPARVSLAQAAPVPAANPAAAPAPAAAPPSAFDLTPVPGKPNLLQLGIPPVPPALLARLEQYQNARAAGLQDVSPDGKQLLVSTRFGSSSQLHVVTAPLGMREQLTFGEEPVFSARFSPADPRVIWFLRDVGGGEFYQVYRLDRRTGRTELVTDGKSRHDALLVSQDGKLLAWAGTGRNGRDTDVYVAEAARPREPRRVIEAEGTFHPLDFSPDGRRLLARQFRSVSDADLLLVDLATGARESLLPGKGSLEGAAFSPDGRTVYAVTDRGSEWNALVRVDPARPGAAPVPAAPGIAWDVEDLAVARDGKVAFTVNADGYSLLHLLDPRTGKRRALPLPAGVTGSLAFPRDRADLLAASVTTPTSPFDVWTVSLGARPALTRWTRSEVGGLDPATFVEPELVRYPSAGGVTVPALLYRPRGAARAPVVVQWHGGPEGQHRPTFSPSYQFLAAELGVAVLLPNVRGSTGYGKSFLAMDDGVKREQALQDIPATWDFVRSRPDLDASRTAAWGGSYGGYMTLATVALFPGLAGSAVNVVGISSLPTFLESTQAYRRDLRRAEYGDERDPAVRAVQERISPLEHVGRIDVPLLVVQGKNDPRVPQSEAEQIVRAVREHGKEVWYLLALDEGHGFRKKPNADHYMAVTMMFLEKQLLDTPGNAPASRSDAGGAGQPGR